MFPFTTAVGLIVQSLPCQEARLPPIVTFAPIVTPSGPVSVAFPLTCAVATIDMDPLLFSWTLPRTVPLVTVKSPEGLSRSIGS